MQIERRETPNRRPGREGHRPEGVVIHTTAGTFDSAAGWFAMEESGVSAHYLIGLDGRVAAFVDEADTALHAGRVLEPTTTLATDLDPNLITIGIEFEDGGDPMHALRPDAQYRAGARLLRGIADRWGITLDRDHVVGHREIFGAKSCPGNVDLDRLLAEARSVSTGFVCLLPVRNGERDLSAYLDSVRGFADAVVALDDGSTDATRAILEADPLVQVLLTNPRRETFAGWDDAENRRRLLETAACLSPGWLLFLDVDERIPPDDAEALRRFLATDAIPGVAYGLRLHRMWGARCDPSYRYVYRLFAHRPGRGFPSERLHFNPVPDDIPRQAWIRTTIRIQHLGAANKERIQERARKYRETDPDGEHAFELDEIPRGALAGWEPRAPDLPVLQAIARHRLVCLLPVRNGEEDLPGYLDSVRRFADAVVALDDGSTDRTRAILEAEPLVKVLIHNAPRDSYAGWDDGRNRTRLLDAAAPLDPEWILFLDADERIAPDDAEALRRFVETEASPGHAYQFRVHRMIDGGFDRADLWVARLFAYETGQRFDGGLHFVPVPAAIPAERRVRTSIRIQHLAGSTDERRRARVEKYRQADPGVAYERLLEPPGTVRPWRSRAPGEPVILDAPRRQALDDHDLDIDAPILSAVVIANDDEDSIERAVRSIVEQRCSEPFEVIVAASGTDRTAEIVHRRFPGVKVLRVGRRALPGEARNAGVRAARGDYVSFPGSHVRLRPGSLEARIRAHQRGFPMVTGSILNGTRTPAGWASYFLDHSGSLPGRPSGPLSSAPAHCSYDREILLRAGGFPEGVRAGEDTVVNNRLHELGYRACRAQEVLLDHASPCRTPPRLVRHHFVRGRAWGRILSEGGHGHDALGDYVRRRMALTDRNVRAWGAGLNAEYRRVRHLVVAGAVAAWAGAGWEIFLRRVRRPSRPGPVTSPR